MPSPVDQSAAQCRIQPRRSSPAPNARHVFGDVHGEGTRQPDRQHLGLKRGLHLGPIADIRAVGGAELARAVDSGCPHQVAHRINLGGIRLPPLRKPVDDMREEPDRPIGAAEAKLFPADPTGLLQRHVGSQSIEVGRRRLAVDQGKGRVLGGCDHPV